MGVGSCRVASCNYALGSRGENPWNDRVPGCEYGPWSRGENPCSARG